MGKAYYNENDLKAAATLRELIKAGEIAPGDVDDRSITDVKAKDLEGYSQCHFFAGIGIWSAALRLAGWGDGRPVWTASCPCQGYSDAGKGEGTGDDRDLWPIFASLIRECKPECILGEQVEAAIRFGWLDRLRTDLEAEAYSVGSVVLGAHSAGADHIRQRLWWVGHADGYEQGRQSWARREEEGGAVIGRTGTGRRLGNSNGGDAGSGEQRLQSVGGECCRMGNTESRGRGIIGDASQPGSSGHIERPGRAGCGGVADGECERLQGHPGDVGGGDESGWIEEEPTGSVAAGGSFGLWEGKRWHYCRDGKHRRVPSVRAIKTESGIQLVADDGAIPCGEMDDGWNGSFFPLTGKTKGRVMLLKGAGNAINLGTAAEFIVACMDTFERRK